MILQVLNFIRRNDLYMWVFITGAIVLVIEIVAVRILAPFFGNTLFSVSSVLSVVLLALSAGYWFGGSWADKNPQRALFYSIIAASGVLVLMMELIRETVLEKISQNFSISTGPLIAATVLFIGPAFLLGTLSPLAIKLKSVENKKLGIGRVTGGMFFWSTLGSISGSLCAGFVLVPQFGVDAIMLSVGIILVVIGGTSLAMSNKLTRQHAIALVFVCSALIFGIVTSREAIAANVLHQSDGIYERITISEGSYRGRSTRFLIQDRSSSGAAFVGSDELVFDYTKYYSLYEAFGTTLEETLVLGGGAYSIPKALLNEPDQPIVDVVEIEPSLYELSQQYFDVPLSDRLNNYIEDGRRFLSRSDKKYDLIYGDVYKSLFSIPSHFTTVEFFELARDRLSDDGVFISNLIGDTYRVDDSFTFAEMQTFRSVFPNSRFFATRTVTTQDTQNIIMVGALGDTPTELDYETLKKHPNPILSGLEAREIDPERFKLDEFELITDNHAPVDFLVSKLLGRSRGNVPGLGDQTLAIVKQLLAYGPRHSGSKGGDAAVSFIEAESAAVTDVVRRQDWTEDDIEYTNVIASIAPEKKRRLIFGSHYDSKEFANLDASMKNQPVPGANDSASGVAALLVAARELGAERRDWPYDFGIDFVFFDGEEGPTTTDSDPGSWRPIGSEYFAEQVTQFYPEKLPEAGVVLDMVCERNAVFKKEPNSLRSAPGLVDAFWESGKEVSAANFSDDSGLGIRDDHTPLNEVGIPSILVIDFEYAPFHTTQDTIDKCSAETLSNVVAATLNFVRSY